MNPGRTIWMGNIEPWMDEGFIQQLFSDLSKQFYLSVIGVFQKKITIIRKNNKRGIFKFILLLLDCAFIELESKSTASMVINNYNGKQYNNIILYSFILYNILESSIG